MQLSHFEDILSKNNPCYQISASVSSEKSFCFTIKKNASYYDQLFVICTTSHELTKALRNIKAFLFMTLKKQQPVHYI